MNVECLIRVGALTRDSGKVKVVSTRSERCHGQFQEHTKTQWQWRGKTKWETFYCEDFGVNKKEGSFFLW